MSYMDDVINYRCKIEDIDDYIDVWHCGNKGEVEIYDYLGMNKDEYFEFVLDPDAIYEIIARRIEQKKFIDKYRDNPEDFVEYLLDSKLKPFQRMMIRLHNKLG